MSYRQIMFLDFYSLQNPVFCFVFFFQAEDGIRDIGVTGVPTCALPIFFVSLLQTVCLLGPIACFAYTIREFPDDPGMTDRGLVDVVSLWYYVGLALCGLGFWLALQRDPLRQRLLAAQTAVLIVVIHALPALAYEAVRPFWAYKHIGVVDYITQNEGVNRSIDVYHNWPGFFALGSIL